MRSTSWVLLVVVSAVSLAACEDGEGDRCARAVRHLTSAMIPEGEAARMSKGERAIMGATGAFSESECRREGLTRAQADCIFAVETIDELVVELPECEAIAEDTPSWIQLPPPEARDRLRQIKRARDAETSD